MDSSAMDGATTVTASACHRFAATHVTLLELALQAVLADAPAETERELQAKRRLREMLLDAAVSQFVGRCDGLQRADAANGLLWLAAPSGISCWRVMHRKLEGKARVVESHVDERAAVRALLLAAALSRSAVTPQNASSA